MKRLALLLAFVAALFVLSGCKKAVSAAASTPQPIVLPQPKANLTVSNQPAGPKATPPPAVAGEDFFNEPEERPGEVNLVIKKSERTLELFGDGEFLGRFPIRIGGNAEGHKEKEGDKRTPEGKYYICSRKDQTENTLFLGLSYPNAHDAEAAYQDKRIDIKTRDAIIKAIDEKKRPPWDTALGGAIGIHGKYDDRESTQGCIAVSDANIAIIWDYAKIGTAVEILP